MHPIINVANKAALAAGREILRALDRLDTLTLTSKGPHDWATDVDERAEQIIIDTIRHSYPSHTVLGEEGGAQNLSGDHATDSEHLWIIDPIDGTINFTYGLPTFCISIAKAYRGKVEHAAIFDPVRQELFNASYGEGAFLNNRRIRVRQTALNNALLSVVNGSIISDKPSTDQFLNYYTTLFTKAAKIRQQGTVALDCAYVAAGRLDGLLAFNMSYWDLAAGALIIQEAGGTAWDFYQKTSYSNRDNLVAGNYELVNKIIATLT